jgi:dTDP-4-amino-4,6-dideoxygalactose transaminase
LYGLYHDRDRIYRLSRQHRAFFFEDAALWFPPHRGYEVLPGSAFGLSFGKFKTFDFGDGALMAFEDRTLASEVARFQMRGPSRPSATFDYLHAFHELAGADYRPKKLGTDFAFLAHSYRDYWVGWSPLPMISLDESLVVTTWRRRVQLAATYRRLLGRLDVKFLTSHPLDMPWRFTFLAPAADRTAQCFRRHGVEVSQFYRPLDTFFPGLRKAKHLANSYVLGSQACNLLLNKSLTDECVRRVDAAVSQCMFELSWQGRMSNTVHRGGRAVAKIADKIRLHYSPKMLGHR